MFRFTIRDMLWLTALLAMGVGWWVDHRVNSAEQAARRTEERVLRWLAKNSYWVRQNGGRHMPRPLPPVMNWDKWIAEGGDIPDIEKALRTLLAKGDARVELAQIAECLGVLGNSDSVPVLIESLGSERTMVRLEAAVALGRLGDKRAIEPLGTILVSDSSENVRANAITALDRISGKDAIEQIEVATNDESRFVSDIAKETVEAFKRGARW